MAPKQILFYLATREELPHRATQLAGAVRATHGVRT